MLKVLTLPLKKKTEKAEKVRRKDRKRGNAGAAAPPKPPTALTRTLAWGVHLYTATGLALAALIAVLLVQGGPGAFRWSFILMALATFIDATDGTLARKIRIKEVIPGFDGRRLDDITDFLTYSFLPLLLIWRANLLPSGTEWCLVVPLLASAYGFCQCSVKTDDGYFLGFPSLWNVVAFYLYALQVPGWTSLAVVITLSLLTFVPSRYLYPSQPGKLNVVHNVLAAGWVVMCCWILYGLPDHETLRATAGGPGRPVTQASLFFPVFYMGASWAVSLRYWLRPRRPDRPQQATPAS